MHQQVFQDAVRISMDPFTAIRRVDFPHIPHPVHVSSRLVKLWHWLELRSTNQTEDGMPHEFRKIWVSTDLSWQTHIVRISFGYSWSSGLHVLFELFYGVAN